MNNKLWATISMLMYGLAFLVVLVVSEKSLDSLQSILISLSLLGFLGYRVYKKYHALQRIEQDLPEELVLDALTLSKEKFKYYRNLLILSIFAFGLLSFLTYTELFKLEAGTTESATTWLPISLIYKIAGFWPAVLIMPLLGAWVMRVFFLKMKEEQDK